MPLLYTSFRIALRALNRNKLRTGLTMLGMIIGVAAVITMVALGNGAQASVEQEVKSAGTNLVMVTAGNYTRGGEDVNIPAGRGAAMTLTPEDAEAIKRIAGVKYSARGVTLRAWIAASSRKYYTRIEGTDTRLPQIYGWGRTRGRFITPQEVAGAARVAVLGPAARDKLFGEDVNPAGQPITIRDQRFTVIGVAGTSDEDQMEMVFVPFTTLQHVLGIGHLHRVIVATEQAGDASRVAAEISRLLRARHNLDPESAAAPRRGLEGNQFPQQGAFKIPDDFTVKTQAGQALTQGLYTSVAAFVLANLPQLDQVNLQEMTSTLQRAGATMTALLASIAAVSLIVGGIGIMNIMLVSVTERTREIGIRRAVGARARDVLLQFLVEAVTLSLCGGVIGIGFGFVASGGITRLLEWPTNISSGAIGLAFGIAAAIGVFFGFYPATRASRVNPIEALRYE
jgi:ABC-type antimicrobial peptide transport system permease subunit